VQDGGAGQALVVGDADAVELVPSEHSHPFVAVALIPGTFGASVVAALWMPAISVMF